MKWDVEKPRILLFDSGSNGLDRLLKSDTFFTESAGTPRNLFEKGRCFQPHLILGDFRSRERAELIRKIRRDPVLGKTPIILCLSQEELTSSIRSAKGQVNDYLVVPFGKGELTRRIDQVLCFCRNLLESNPLSQLPGNVRIKTEIEQRLALSENFFVAYLDLDHFKAYNDYYGYSRGDDVICFVAELLRRELSSRRHSSPFVGHIGGDDFILTGPIQNLDERMKGLLARFDFRIGDFYREADRKNGHIIGLNRKGEIQKFPLMSLSIAVVLCHSAEALHFGEISARGAEIKSYLKNLPGSNFLIDRREKLLREPFSALSKAS